MNKYVLVNGNVQKAVKETVERMQEVVNGLRVPLRCGMTTNGHLSLCKAVTRDIYNTSFVIHTIVIDVKGTTSDYEVTGTVFRSIGGNSPYARALAKANGDYDKKGETIGISEYDKKEGVIPKYDVLCGDETAKTLYIDAESLATIDFSCLNDTIKEMLKGKKEAQQNFKREVINKVLSNGMVINKDKTARLATAEDEKVYNIISWSPSNERSETALLTSIELPIAEMIINEISGNAIYSAVRRSRKIKDLVKFSKRIGIFGAPATETATFGNELFGCMLYMHEIQGPEDYDAENKAKLLEKGIEIDRNTYDGSYMISAEFTQAMYKAKGKNISLSQALMMALQTRASVLASKVFGEAKSKSNMNYRKDLLINMVDPDKILRLQPGQDVTGLDKSNYDLIIIGSEDNVGVIMDKNGAKALGDISLKELAQGNFMNYVLDAAKASKTNISGQMLQKFISINKKESLIAYLELMDRQFDKRLGKSMEGDINPFKSSLAQFIFRYVDQRNRAALEDLIKTELSQTESHIKKFNVEIDALYLRALFDDAYFITKGKINGVLGKNKYTGRLEAYSYDVEVMFKDEIEAIYADDTIVNKDEALAKLLTGVAFKYPSPSADENAIFTFLTAKQITERIANMDNLTKKERGVLMDDFVNTSFGVIKMAPNNTIKHRLAGMDTDYDGVAIVFEKVLVDIIVNHYVDNDGITVKKDL